MTNADCRLALAQKRVQVLDHLHRCVCRQEELIREGDLDRLLALLQGDKQRALLAWQRVEKSWQAAAAEDRPWADPAQRQLYQQQVHRGQKLLEQIVQLEQRCEQRMQTRRRELQLQMHQAHQANQAAQAYAQEAPPQPGQLDLLSDA